MTVARLRKQPARLDPSTGETFDDSINRRWTGKRRKHERRPSLTWQLPEGSIARRKSFDEWHAIAMQVLHEAGCGFRCIAVFKNVFYWSEGVIRATDAEFARRGGRCSEKTISRELRDYEALGIVRIENGWRRSGKRIVRTRTLRLALPRHLSPETVIVDATDTDHSGPDGECDETPSYGQR